MLDKLMFISLSKGRRLPPQKEVVKDMFVFGEGSGLPPQKEVVKRTAKVRTHFLLKHHPFLK